MFSDSSDCSNYATPRQSPGNSFDDTIFELTLTENMPNGYPNACTGISRNICCLHGSQPSETTLSAPFPTSLPACANGKKYVPKNDNEYLKAKLTELKNEAVQLEVWERHLAMVAKQLSSSRSRVSQVVSELNDKLRKPVKEQVQMRNVGTQTKAEKEQLLNIQPPLKKDVNRGTSTKSNVTVSSYMRKVPKFTTSDTQKLVRMQAIIRGNFVRRLMSSIKVKEIKKTICDITLTLQDYEKEPQTSKKNADIIFYNSLISQLKKSSDEFYAIFFGYTKEQQKQLIIRSKDAELEQSRRLSRNHSDLVPVVAKNKSISKKKSISHLTNDAAFKCEGATSGITTRKRTNSAPVNVNLPKSVSDSSLNMDTRNNIKPVNRQKRNTRKTRRETYIIEEKISEKMHY